MEKLYTKNEVQQVIEPLIRQIEYLYSKKNRYDSFLLNTISNFFNLHKIVEFLKHESKYDLESNTLIENLIKISRDQPELFERIKSLFDSKHILNN